MDTLLFILTLGGAVVAGFLVGGKILSWLLKKFGASEANFKSAVKIIIWYTILISALAALFYLVNFIDALASLAIIVISFVLFYLLLRKNYGVGLGKSVAVYILFFFLFNLVGGLLIVLPVRQFLFSPFSVKGEAMAPSYNDGDYLVVRKFASEYQRSDVVVFEFPKENTKYSNEVFIKRIVGMPGEKIEIRNGQVFINGVKLEEPYIASPSSDNLIVNLNKDEYYMMGDNRTKSLDSRAYGPIPKNYIIGEVTFRILNLKNN